MVGGTGLFTHRFAPGTEFPLNIANAAKYQSADSYYSTGLCLPCGRVGFLANEVDVHILGVIENQCPTSKYKLEKI